MIKYKGWIISNFRGGIGVWANEGLGSTEFQPVMIFNTVSQAKDWIKSQLEV